MKTIFTFLFVNLIFLSTIAQSTINSQHENCDKQLYETFFESYDLQDCNKKLFGLTSFSPYTLDGRQNSLELKQGLDSVVTEYYDNEDWIKYYLSEYAYNPKGFNSQSINHELNEEESEMVPMYKNDFFFDENGNVTSINHSRQEENSGSWEYSHKTTYAYDVDLNLTNYILYGRNESNTDWIPFHKVEFDFDSDSDGKVIKSRSYGWNELNNDWNFIGKEDFTYDENNYLVQRTSYSQMGDEWRNSRKTEYVNDQDGNTLQRTSFKSLDGVDWVYNSRDERVFNLSGLVTKVTRADWIDSTNTWMYDIRQDYAYDTDENLTESITFAWDTVSNDWLYVSKVELAYNLNFVHEDILLPTSWPEFSITYNIMPLYKNMLTEVVYFTKVDTTWKIEDREIYYYADRDVSSVSDLITDQVKIYPNPANDFISIEGFVNSGSVVADLFDQQGRQLLTQDVSESNRINVSHLKSGLYFCKIKQNDQTIIQKILIK